MPDRVLLGTSGWTYAHWKGVFYPESLAQRMWFEYYAERFPTVEINASFYRIPTEKTVEGWNRRSPDDFTFSVKMSRLITHIRHMRNCSKELDWFFTNFRPLAAKIGMYLVQLPPALKFDDKLLRDFIDLLPDGIPAAFEFRNTSWYREETCRILADTSKTFCIHDMKDLVTERIVIGSQTYIRFHGHGFSYGGDYPDELLRSWADWIGEQQARGVDVFGYFNNDWGGYAVKNCRTLREMVGVEVGVEG